MTVEQPTASAGDVERLARLLSCDWCAVGPGEPCREWDAPVAHLHEGDDHSRGRLRAARELLASDWLATLLADVRREERERWEAVLDKAEADIRAYEPNLVKGSIGYGLVAHRRDADADIVREARGGAR